MTEHGPKLPPEPRYTGQVKTFYVGGPQDGRVHGFSCCPDSQMNESRTRIEYVCAGCDEKHATLVYVAGGST